MDWRCVGHPSLDPSTSLRVSGPAPLGRRFEGSGGAFDLDGDDVDAVIFSVLYGGCVVAQESEGDLAGVWDLGLVSEVGKPVLNVLVVVH